MIEEIFKKAIEEFHYDINILPYNQTYADRHISAYDIREQDYERIIREKSGACFNFSLFLNRQLDQLGIDSRCAILETSGKEHSHMIVLYKQDSQILVGDLSNAILGIPKLKSKLGNSFNLDIMLGYFTSRTLLEYMREEGYEECLIVQKILDNGEEIKVVPYKFDTFYNSINANTHGFSQNGFDTFYDSLKDDMLNMHMHDVSQKMNQSPILDSSITVTEDEYIGSTTIAFSRDGKVYRSYTDEEETVLQIKTEKDSLMKLMTENEDYLAFMDELKKLDSSTLAKYKDIIDSLPEVFLKQSTTENLNNINDESYQNFPQL